MGDGARALRYLCLAPEAQLREVDFANAIHACAMAVGNNNNGNGGNGARAAGGGGSGGSDLLEEAVAAFRRLQGLRTARAGCVHRPTNL